jgi:hypothetical protein
MKQSWNHSHISSFSRDIHGQNRFARETCGFHSFTRKLKFTRNSRSSPKLSHFSTYLFHQTATQCNWDCSRISLLSSDIRDQTRFDPRRRNLTQAWKHLSENSSELQRSHPNFYTSPLMSLCVALSGYAYETQLIPDVLVTQLASIIACMNFTINSVSSLYTSSIMCSVTWLQNGLDTTTVEREEIGDWSQL